MHRHLPGRARASLPLFATLLMTIGALPACSSDKHAPTAAGSPGVSLPPRSGTIPSAAATSPSAEEPDIERGRPGTAEALSIGPELRTTLADLYFAAHPDAHRPRSAVTPLGNVYYGVVFGSARDDDHYYVLADIGFDAEQNRRPNLWQRDGTTPWSYQGESQFRVCVPEALYNAWNFPSFLGAYSKQHCPK